jgi:hypothetical protein
MKQIKMLIEDNRMKSELGMNILLITPPDVLHRRLGFQIYLISKKELKCMNANFVWMCQDCM